MSTALTMVRNTANGPAVFSVGPHHIEWQGRGDQMGRDIQSVPPAILETVEFHRAMESGIFEIETDEDAKARAAGLHRQDWTDRQAAQQAASLEALDHTPNNDSLMKDCVGPSANGRGVCGVPVPVKVSQQADKPPLCGQHTSLSGQYISEESTDRVIGGKPEVVWKPIQIGARTRQD